MRLKSVKPTRSRSTRSSGPVVAVPPGWTAASAGCGACEVVFTSVAAFDAHLPCSRSAAPEEPVSAPGSVLGSVSLPDAERGAERRSPDPGVVSPAPPVVSPSAPAVAPSRRRGIPVRQPASRARPPALPPGLALRPTGKN